MSEASSYPVGDKSQFYYRHSGRAPLGSLILALVVGVAFAIPAAIVYAAADIYIFHSSTLDVFYVLPWALS